MTPYTGWAILDLGRIRKIRGGYPMPARFRIARDHPKDSGVDLHKEKKSPMALENSFKLTYATMFNPPAELHAQYEQALAKIKAGLGRNTPC